MHEFVCGIDFGTSNSAIAIYDLSIHGLSTLNGTICRPIPSLLFFPTTEKRAVYVGDEAVASYVNSNYQGRFLQSLKTFLTASAFEGTTINGKYYELTDLVALILRYLKKTAEQVLGASVERVVLGRPVKFAGENPDEDLALRRLRQAAKTVGFKEILFEFEPIAAALYYQTLVERDELVLVGDFGGGTSDFTLMSLSPSATDQATTKSTVLGTAGLPFAGNKFDSEIMGGKLIRHFGHKSMWWADDKWMSLPNYIFLDICEWHQIPFLRDRRTLGFLKDVERHTNDPQGVKNLVNLIFGNYGYSVFQRIEEAKIGLSSSDTAEIQCEMKRISFREPIAIQEFDQLIQPHIDSIEKCVVGLLQKYSVTTDQIDNVFLTGGTSEVRAVRNLFGKLFGTRKIRAGKTFTSVAEGLGLAAGNAFKRQAAINEPKT
jgi:hypothetical chaperone protein